MAYLSTWKQGSIKKISQETKTTPEQHNSILLQSLPVHSEQAVARRNEFHFETANQNTNFRIISFAGQSREYIMISKIKEFAVINNLALTFYWFLMVLDQCILHSLSVLFPFLKLTRLNQFPLPYLQPSSRYRWLCGVSSCSSSRWLHHLHFHCCAVREVTSNHRCYPQNNKLFKQSLSRGIKNLLWSWFFFIVRNRSFFMDIIFCSSVVLVWTFNTRSVYN